MGKIGLIIKREYTSKVKKKSFIVMTFLGPILMVGLFVGAVFLTMKDGTKHNVLVIDKTPINYFANQFNDSKNIHFEYETRDISDEEFETSPYTLMLRLNAKAITNNTVELYHKKSPSLRVQSTIQDEVNKVFKEFQIKENNIAPELYQKLMTSINVEPVNYKSKEEQSDTRRQMGIGFGFAIVIYFFIFLYGVQVMRGVIEEKTNRIVEVIISSVKPFQLMMGKIIGIAGVALTQIIIWILFSGVLFTIAQIFFLGDLSNPAAMAEAIPTAEVMEKVNALNKASENEILQTIQLTQWHIIIPVFIFYFIGGYLLYASLFAAVGSAVDSETDTQQFVLPISIPLVFGFIVAELAFTNPDGGAVSFFSIFPLTSPIVMMVRAANGVDYLTLFTSMILLAITFISTTWIAGKIYRTGILMYGKKASWKEIWKWIFYR